VATLATKPVEPAFPTAGGGGQRAAARLRRHSGRASGGRGLKRLLESSVANHLSPENSPALLAAVSASTTTTADEHMDCGAGNAPDIANRAGTARCSAVAGGDEQGKDSREYLN